MDQINKIKEDKRDWLLVNNKADGDRTGNELYWSNYDTEFFYRAQRLLTVISSITLKQRHLPTIIYTSKRSVKIVATDLKKLRFYPLKHTYMNRTLSNEAFNALS